MQVRGAGQVFETINSIDFSNDYNEEGVPNRIIEPILNGNQDIIKYRITKREKIKAGATKILKREVLTADATPFYQLNLPEPNVLEVLNVIVYEGQLGITSTPTYQQFNDATLRYYEVDYLPTNKIFTTDDASIRVGGFYVGKYVEVEKRFEKEFLPNGSCTITFGGGQKDYDAYDAFLTNLSGEKCQGTDLDISKILNNTALGVVVAPNSTIFVRYRIGGGKNSNLGVNVINSIDNVEFNVNGPVSTVNSQVIQSLRVSNVTPAIGGADQPTIDEIRNMISYNFAAQNRAVTLNDYKSVIENMPPTFGAAAKVNVMEEDNKVKIKLLSYDADGNLTDVVSNTLKDNVTEYISQYRMINDFVEIQSGEVIDLGLEIDVVIDRNEIESDVIKSIIEKTISYFAIEKRKMGDPLFTGELLKEIGSTSGVVNVVDVRVFNKTGGEYSQAEVSQTYKTPETKEILQADMTVYMKSNQIFQIRFPNKDIKVRVKPLTSTTF